MNQNESPLLVPAESPAGRRPRRRKDIGRLGSPSPVARRLSWTPPPQVLQQLTSKSVSSHPPKVPIAAAASTIISNSESETVADPDAIETDDTSERCSSSDAFVNPPPRLEKGRIRRFIKKKSPGSHKVMISSPAASQDTNNMEVSPPTDTPITPTRSIQPRSTLSSCGSTEQLSTLKEALKARELEAANSTQFKNLMMSQLKQLESQNNYLLSECESERKNKSIYVTNMEEAISRGSIDREYDRGFVLLSTVFIASIVKRVQSVELEIEAMKEIVSASDEAPELRRELERQAFLQQTLQQQLVKEATQREKAESLLRISKRENSEPREGSPNSLHLTLSSLEEQNESLKNQLQKALSSLSTARAERDAYLAANTSNKDARQLRETDVSFAVIRADLSKARDEARSKTQEIDLLQKQLQRYQTELGSPEIVELQLREELEHLTESTSTKIRHLEAKQKALTQENNRLLETRDRLEHSAQASEDQIYQLEHKLKTLTHAATIHQNSTTTIDRLTNEVDELSAKLQDVSSQLSDSQREVTITSNNAATKLTAIKEELDASKRRLQDTQNQLCTLQSELTESEDREAELFRESNEQKEVIEELQYELEELQQEVDRKKADDSNEDTKAALQIKTREAAEQKEMITHLEQQLMQRGESSELEKELMAQLAENRREMKKSLAEVCDKSREVKELRQKVKALEAQNITAAATNDVRMKQGSGSSASELLRQIENLQQQKRASDSRQAALENELSDLKQRTTSSDNEIISELREERDFLRNEIDALTDQLQTLNTDQTIKDLKEANLQLQNEVTAFSKQTHDLKEEVTSLRSELQDAKNVKTSVIISELKEEREYLRSEVDTLNHQLKATKKATGAEVKDKGSDTETDPDCLDLPIHHHEEVENLKEERAFLRQEVDHLVEQLQNVASDEEEKAFLRHEVDELSRQLQIVERDPKELASEIIELKEERLYLRQEVDHLTEELQAARDQSNDVGLKQEREFLRREVASLTQKLQSVDITNRGGEKEYAAVAEERDFLRKEVEELTRQLQPHDLLNRQLEELNIELTTITKRGKAEKKELETIRSERTQLQKELEAATNEHKSLQSDLTNAIKQLASRDEGLLEVEELRGQVNELQSLLSKSESELQHTADRFESSSREKMALMQTVESLETDVLLSNNKNKLLSEEIMNHNNELSDLHTSIDASNRQTDELINEVAELSSKLQAAVKERDTALTQLSNEQTNTRLSGELQAEVATLNSRLEESATECNSLREQLQTVQEQQQQQVDQGTNLHGDDKQSRMESEISHLRESLESQSASYAKLQSEQQELTRRVAEGELAIEEKECLECEIAEMVKINKRTKAELQAVKRDHDKLEKTLQSERLERTPQKSASLLRERDDLLRDVKELTRQLENAERYIQEETRSIKDERDYLAAEVTSLKELLPSKTDQRETQDLLTERKWLKQERNDIANRLDARTEELNEMQAHIQQMTDIHNKSMEGVNNQNKALTEDIDSLRSQLSKMSDEATAANNEQVRELRTDCRMLEKELATERQLSTDLQMKLTTLEEVVSDSDLRLRDSQQQLARLRADGKSLQAAIDRSETELQQKDKQIASLTTELKESDHSEEANDLRDEVRNLKKVLKQRESELRNLQQCIKDQEALQKQLKQNEKERHIAASELKTAKSQHEVEQRDLKTSLEGVQKERDDAIEELRSLRSNDHSLLETSDLTIKDKVDLAPRRQLDYQQTGEFYSTGDLEGLLSERSPETVGDDFQSDDCCSDILSSIGEPISSSTKRLLRVAEEAISAERSRNRLLNARVREKDIIVSQQSRQIKTLKSRMQVLSSALTSDINDTPPTTPVGGSYVTPRGVSGSAGSDIGDDASLSSLPSSASALRYESRGKGSQHQAAEKLHNTRSVTSSSSRKSKSPSASSRCGGESFHSVLLQVSDLSKKHLPDRYCDADVPKHLRSRSAKAAWRQGGL